MFARVVGMVGPPGVPSRGCHGTARSHEHGSHVAGGMLAGREEVRRTADDPEVVLFPFEEGEGIDAAVEQESGPGHGPFEVAEVHRCRNGDRIALGVDDGEMGGVLPCDLRRSGTAAPPGLRGRIPARGRISPKSRSMFSRVRSRS